MQRLLRELLERVVPAENRVALSPRILYGGTGALSIQRIDTSPEPAARFPEHTRMLAGEFSAFAASRPLAAKIGGSMPSTSTTSLTCVCRTFCTASRSNSMVSAKPAVSSLCLCWSRNAPAKGRGARRLQYRCEHSANRQVLRMPRRGSNRPEPAWDPAGWPRSRP